MGKHCCDLVVVYITTNGDCPSNNSLAMEAEKDSETLDFCFEMIALEDFSSTVVPRFTMPSINDPPHIGSHCFY
jgi:hypothetical protein